MVVSSGFENIDVTSAKGILLDMDNTLYPYQPCHDHAIMQCFLEFSKIKEDIDYEGFTGLYQKSRVRINSDLKSQGASHSRLLYFQRLFEDVFGKSSYSLTLQFENTYWENFFNIMRLDPHAQRFLAKARQSNIPVCIITDLTAQVQFKKILRLGIDDDVQWIVSSEEAGVEKPHSYVYKLAMEKLQLGPNELIAIGDDIKKDIGGASLLGIKNYLIQWSGSNS